MTDELPLVAPPFNPPTDRPRVAGILLAAGMSRRFGDRNKLLATRPIDGELPTAEPLVRASAQTLCAAGVEPVIAVVGHQAPRVESALAGLDVEVVYNDAYATGQASSIRAGIDAVRDRDVTAAVIALGDMPDVNPATVDTVVDAYATGAGVALAAAYEAQRGNPVLFDRRFFDALTAIDDDQGGRAVLLSSEASALVAVPDPGVCRDIDTPADL